MSHSGNELCQNGGMAQRPYAGVPAEERRALRRAELLAAALDLMGSEGSGRLTVGALCARAGLNERYFYENFTSRDDVAVAVYEAIVDDISRAILAAVVAAPDDARSKARAAIAAAVELLTEDPRKSAVVFVEAASVPALVSRRTSTARAFTALIVEQANAFYGAPATADAGRRVEVAAAHLYGALAEALTSWNRGDLPVSRSQLIDESAELFVLVAERLADG
jgi:AcrR family transcriptional regulator